MIGTTIYCYSATGNSLVLARAIARALEDTDIRLISRYRKIKTTPRCERVGIIFPVYAWGPPRTVEEFVRNLDLRHVRYNFAIASCGGTAAGTLLRLRKAMRKNGGELHAGFIAKSPGYLAGSGHNSLIATVRCLSGKPYPPIEERLPEIIEWIRNEKRIRPERSALPGAILGNFFHTKAKEQFPRLDANHEVGESCKSCGTCTRVCPRGNVTLMGGRPGWHHDCDFCGACATWCPNNAIRTKGMPVAPRSHNTEVNAADLMWA